MGNEHGVISWQEAYIKARWPAEYLCACLNDVLRKGWRDRYERFVEDARNHNIEVIPPCVNRSRAECFVNDDGAIVLGLSMVKGVGKSGSKAQENAPYKSYRDFVLRSGMATADTVKSVKRSLRGELFGDDGLIIGGEGCIDDTTLSMIHGGCFDQAHPRRAILEECHPTADVTAAQKREAPVSIFERKWVVGPPRREGYALMRERGGDVESTIPVKVKRRPGTVQNRPGGYDIDTPAYVDASLLDRGCSTEHLVSETIVTGFQGPSVSGGDFVVDDKELWSRACEAWLIGHETRARILFKRAMSIRALRKADAIEGEVIRGQRGQHLGEEPIVPNDAPQDDAFGHLVAVLLGISLHSPKFIGGLATVIIRLHDWPPLPVCLRATLPRPPCAPRRSILVAGKGPGRPQERRSPLAAGFRPPFALHPCSGPS